MLVIPTFLAASAVSSHRIRSVERPSTRHWVDLSVQCTFAIE